LDFWVLIVSGMAFLGFVAAGTYLWWPARHDAPSRSSLGAALMTGAVVSFAIFLLQIVMETRLNDIEHRRASERALQDIRQQVAVSPSLEGYDFHTGEIKDLSGFYFVNKNLSAADFRNMTLKHGNFAGANLSRAYLDGAKLHDANLTFAKLENAFLPGAELIDADLTQACLRSADLKGADLTGADLTGADLSDARVDSETVWMNGRKRQCRSSECFLPERRVPGKSCG
jgi:uncharacterized protein YjbI with pentapeptide repeats